MSTTRIWAAAVIAAGLAGGTAYAADQSTTSTNAANADFGKLSQDGFNALRDIRLTRLAIFDGDTSQAKQEIDQAASSLQKAQSDDSVYTKAEADLKTPSGMTQQGKSGETASTTPVKWLPVDGAFALGEDYLAAPDKAKAVNSADAQIKQGDHKQAMDTLKLAHVNVVFDVEVAPLEKTLAGVEKARQLIDNGKYFEANQQLKSVEAGMRYDVEDFTGTPQPQKTSQSG